MNYDLKSLESIFRTVFDDPKIILKRETTPKDIPLWDSLMHIQVIVAVEKACDVRFLPGEIYNLKNVGEFLDLVAQKKSAPKN